MLAAPVCAAGGCLESAGPDKFYAACLFRELGDLALGDGCVELGEEGFGDGVFLLGKCFSLGADLFDAGI
jgi:hypothetical protein